MTLPSSNDVDSSTLETCRRGRRRVLRALMIRIRRWRWKKRKTRNSTSDTFEGVDSARKAVVGSKTWKNSKKAKSGVSFLMRDGSSRNPQLEIQTFKLLRKRAQWDPLQSSESDKSRRLKKWKTFAIKRFLRPFKGAKSNFDERSSSVAVSGRISARCRVKTSSNSTSAEKCRKWLDEYLMSSSQNPTPTRHSSELKRRLKLILGRFRKQRMEKEEVEEDEMSHIGGATSIEDFFEKLSRGNSYFSELLSWVESEPSDDWRDLVIAEDKPTLRPFFPENRVGWRESRNRIQEHRLMTTFKFCATAHPDLKLKTPNSQGTPLQCAPESTTKY